MNKISVVILVSLALLSGCTAMNSREFASPLSLEARALHEPIIEVGEKITGESSLTHFLFWDIGGETEYADGVVFDASDSASAETGLVGAIFGSSLDSATGVKKAAAYNAIQKSGADVIIAPQYRIRKTDMIIFTTYKATVEGYRGTIKGFKQISIDPNK